MALLLRGGSGTSRPPARVPYADSASSPPGLTVRCEPAGLGSVLCWPRGPERLRGAGARFGPALFCIIAKLGLVPQRRVRELRRGLLLNRGRRSNLVWQREGTLGRIVGLESRLGAKSVGYGVMRLEGPGAVE